MVRLAHVWSHDVGIPAAWPTIAPLHERGWDLTFIAPPGPHGEAARARGIRVRPLALRRAIHPASDLLGAAQLASYFARDRPDIVHTHNAKPGLIGRVAAYATRVPVVVHTVHGLTWSLESRPAARRIHALFERLASVRVDAVMVQSEEDRRILVESGATPDNRIVWIGNGIDLAAFDPARVGKDARARVRAELQLSDDDVLFVSAGRLVREKGFVELFEATALARRTNRRIHVAVAGDVDIEKVDALDERVLTAAAADEIRLLGRRNDMPALLAAADVVALPSWREGLPRILMEGAAMGKALLAADARGCREVVRDRVNGRLVPVRDATRLAEAMLELTADRAARERWGATARGEAAERYDIHAVVRRVFDVYARLLDARGIAHDLSDAASGGPTPAPPPPRRS
jgi:glycosyltransferase involved in cell wall biosynthesis